MLFTKAIMLIVLLIYNKTTVTLVGTYWMLLWESPLVQRVESGGSCAPRTIHLRAGNCLQLKHFRERLPPCPQKWRRQLPLMFLQYYISYFVAFFTLIVY